jgi:hypothetical protein
MYKKIFLFLLIAVNSLVLFSQQTDSIAIRKTHNAAEYSRDYSTVIFNFFYLNTKKEIKLVALNIDDIRLATGPQNGYGAIQVYLSDKKTYKVFVHHSMYQDSRVFDINVDTKYDYVVDIYLSVTKKPMH